MRRLFNRLFPTSQPDSNRILQEYSLAISNITDPKTLATITIDQIQKALGIKGGYLYEVEFEADPEGGSFRLASLGGLGQGSPEEVVLPARNPLVEQFQKSRQLVTIEELNSLPSLQPPAKVDLEWLRRQETVLFVPVHAKEEWIGLIALGPKVSGKPFTQNDRLLVCTLADLISLALQNARLIGSLLRVNNDFRRAYSAMEQSNRQLQQVVNQLEKIDKTKSDFISIASHELRTPLTVMRGYTEMLIDDAASKKNDHYQKLLTGIRTGILRMHEIVENMLDMATIDALSYSLHKGSISVMVLVRSILDELKPALEERTLTMSAENLRDLPMIEADNEALGKVFRNLILNAIKYTPDGGRITISGVNITPGQMDFQHGGVEIIVSDTGIGIAPDTLDLIFTKFYQTGGLSLHSTGKTKFKGAGPGLGLSIAKGIVEAHGGKIWAESPGYDEKTCPGSQFHIALPLPPSP